MERRRVSRACIRCKDRKLKCSGKRPTCSRCLDRGIECHYPTTPASRQSHHVEASESSGFVSPVGDSRSVRDAQTQARVQATESYASSPTSQQLLLYAPPKFYKHNLIQTGTNKQSNNISTPTLISSIQSHATDFSIELHFSNHGPRMNSTHVFC